MTSTKTRHSFRKIAIGVMAATTFSACSLSAQAAEPLAFNYNNVALSALKMAIDQNIQKLSDVAPMGMISFFMPAVYNQSSGNEFAMHAAEPKAVAKAANILKGWSAPGPYRINTDIQFKDYDFSSKTFPLEVGGKDTYFTISRPWRIQDGGTASPAFPAPDYQVFFDNQDLIQTLNMPEDKAATFVQKRTSGSYVNRGLSEEITFNITGFKKSVLGSIADNNGNVMIMAHITQIKLYAGNQHQTLLQTYVAKP